MLLLSTRIRQDGCMTLAVAMRRDWAARQPSPKKLPRSRMPTTASLPRVETTVSLTLPVSMKNTASAASPWEKTTCLFR